MVFGPTKYTRGTMKPNNRFSEDLQKQKPVAFTAMSKRNFYQRFRVMKYVLENNVVPINPFMSFDYFLADAVDHNLVRNANNNLVRRADELWVFGEISDGVQAEIDLAKNLDMPIKYYTLEPITETTTLVYEE